MKQNTYQKTGRKVSALGLGCMRLPLVTPEKPDIDYERAQEIVDYAIAHGVNYFDTAYGYHGGKSQHFVGHALSRYPRDSYCLATKLPAWNLKEEGDVARIFQEQLDQCRTDYFDFYLFHCINKENWKTFEKFGAYEYLSEMKRQGKIRSLGFSYHDDVPFLEQVCSGRAWDFAQLQLNYFDWDYQDAKGQYEVLERHGMPCVVMEPVRGGALAHLSDEADRILKEAHPDWSIPSWAIRFAASLPNVLTVLSGMSTLEQTADNVATLTDFQPLTQADRAVLDRALAEFRKGFYIPCTACRYCVDTCPQHIDIPRQFSLSNQYHLNRNAKDFLETYGKEEIRADSCISCGTCLSYCPQGIRIPDELKKLADTVTALRG